MSILGLIPARAGSKGIPGKNIKKLGGKELIRYTIEAALSCSGLQEVIVSTEDKGIADISRRAGAAVPFLRPPALASDSSPTIDTVKHALQFFDAAGRHFDAVCLLQPTTPFRSARDIDQAIEKYLSSGADSLISVREVPHVFNPHWVFEPMGGSDFLRTAVDDTHFITRRQDLPAAYYRDGAIYITSRQVLLEKSSFYGQKLAYCMLTDSPDINLDTPADWARAEDYLEQLNQ